jgi:hypothetical protein
MRTTSSRQAGLVLALLTLGITFACSDNVVAPNAKSEVRASGVWASSVWKPGATDLQYVASATGVVDVVLGAHTFSAHQNDTRAVALGPIEVESLRRSLQSSLLASSDPGLGSTHSVNARGPAVSITQAFKTRSLRLKGTGGDNLRLEFIDHPLGGGRPPLAVMIYRNERPVMLNEYTYVRDGKGWRAIRSRSSILDANGKVSLISEQDLSRIRQGGATATVGSARWFRQGIGSGGALLARLVQPDALYADVIPIDDGCTNELLALVEATANEAALAIALGLAIGSCATPLSELCLLLIAGAQAALAAADIALGRAIADYYACKHPTADPTGNNGISPGSGGTEGPGCTLYIVRKSLDGGQTWLFVSTFEICR